jgi:hypothetical protein
MNGEAAISEDLVALGLQLDTPTRSLLSITMTSLHMVLELSLTSWQLRLAAPHTLYAGKLTGLCGKQI